MHEYSPSGTSRRVWSFPTLFPANSPSVRGWLRLAVATFVACSLFSPLCAQAPVELAGVVVRCHLLGAGVPTLADFVMVLDVDDTYAELYWKNSVSPTPALPREGTFVYAATSATTATLALSPDGEPSYTFNLTFSTPTSGSVAGPGGAGTFSVTPIPLPGPLVNTSQRAFVSETQPAIVGFVVPPGQTTLVLVRAIGPGLQAFAVAASATDPALAVFRDQQLVAENDNWDDEPGMRATIAMTGSFVGAFPLLDGATDAATVLLLGPGNYTVQIRNRPGEPPAEVLGEVYAIP